MKQIVSSACAAAIIGWLGYTLATADPCERVQRSAAPVRAVFDIARWGAQNFVSANMQTNMIYWSAAADEGTQRFTNQMLYGATHTCPGKF